MKRRKTYGKHSSNVRKSRARRANQNGKLNKKKVAIVLGIIFIIFSLIINKNKNKKVVENLLDMCYDMIQGKGSLRRNSEKGPLQYGLNTSVLPGFVPT